MRIILVGSGIGGLSAALALPSHVQVTLLERAQRLGAVGAGIQLSPNAMGVLQRLGLDRQVATAGFAPQAVRVRRASDGAVLLDQPLGDFAARRWGAPYIQIHRADLQSILIDAVRRRPNCELLTGATVASLKQDDAQVAVRLETGETLDADMVIGCDGLRSAVRQVLWGGDQPRYTGHTAWRGVVDAARLPAGLIDPVAAVWTGPTRHFVHYFVRGGTAVNFVGVVERTAAGAESWSESGDPDELSRDFEDWPAPVRAIIAACDSAWRWSLYDRPPLARWSLGRASLLGDAAHPMTPFLAQGAAMALEDAEALGRAVSSASDPIEALRLYEAERRPRARRVQAASQRNARLFHLPDAAAGAAFGAARALDRIKPGGGAARLDWLYGRAG